MNYHFGPYKPKFTESNEEWTKLKQEIAWYNEETSNYPFVTVFCPHCGVKNVHNAIKSNTHRECHLMRDKNYNKIYYDCSGYIIRRYINTPI